MIRTLEAMLAMVMVFSSLFGFVYAFAQGLGIVHELAMDDNQAVLATLLKRWDILYAYHEGNVEMMHACMRSALHPDHEYYVAFVKDGEAIELGKLKLREGAVSVTLYGWGGGRSPFTITINVGVEG